MMVRSYGRLANKFDQKETWFFVEKSTTNFDMLPNFLSSIESK